MAQIDYEITTFDKAILHLFLALGALPPIPPPSGGFERSQPPPWALPIVNIIWATLPSHYEMGSSVGIPLNTKDNLVPHPTISHLETDYINSTAASFDGQ